MKIKYLTIAVSSLFLFLGLITNTIADEKNIPITAEQAFDAVTQQIDPLTKETSRIALVDLRTTAEFYWVGACAKTVSIETRNRVYYPKHGKVELKWGSYLVFRTDTSRRHRTENLPLWRVKNIQTQDISIHIPTHIWDEEAVETYPNLDFSAQVEALSSDYDVIILMCRNGERSNTRDFNTQLFNAVYEIDQPDGTDGYGGFQGNSYGDTYNGFRGFPGRNTWRNKTRSVSWTDAGLPIHIGSEPFAPDVPETTTDEEDDSDNDNTDSDSNGDDTNPDDDYYVSPTPI